MKDHVNVSDEKFARPLSFSFIIIFISMKTNSVLTCWNLEKSIGWRTLITFQMNGKAFLKRMLKNRMNIRWCFINVYARTRYLKILKLPNNKICVKLTPWALKLSRPTKKWSARSKVKVVHLGSWHYIPELFQAYTLKWGPGALNYKWFILRNSPLRPKSWQPWTYF